MKKIDKYIGAGGSQMHDFIKECILSKLGNSALDRLDDSALIDSKGRRIAFTTDSYVVTPLFFKGGDIGRLAVSGTVNDLLSLGSKPHALSLAFIIEEGLEYEIIVRIVDSIARTADEAGVIIATGDTKVVEGGKCDGLYINTSGIGFIDDGVNISSHNAADGDIVIATGSIGNHEASLLIERLGFGFEAQILSDVAPLSMQIERLLKKGARLKCIKDPTRGGLASALVEISEHSGVEIEIDENFIPIDREVRGLCELTGFDPLYLACEGRLVIVADRSSAEMILDEFKSRKAAVIGEIKKSTNPRVILKTKFGSHRRLTMLEGMQLPRIC